MHSKTRKKVDLSNPGEAEGYSEELSEVHY